MQYFLQGLTMGLAYVAPIGLQNLFVINSALTHNRRRALLTAWIVIFFDVTLAFACFFGIGAVMQRFQWLQMAILFVGSLIVIGLCGHLVQSTSYHRRDHDAGSLSRHPARGPVHPLHLRRGYGLLSLVHGDHPCHLFVQ